MAKSGLGEYLNVAEDTQWSGVGKREIRALKEAL
jgi:hypothetical protein